MPDIGIITVFAYGFCPYAVRCLSYTHSILSSSSRLPLPTQSSRPYLPSAKLYMYISRVCARAHAGLPQTKDLVIIYFYTFFFILCIIWNYGIKTCTLYTRPMCCLARCCCSQTAGRHWQHHVECIGSVHIGYIYRYIGRNSFHFTTMIFFSAFERHGKLCCFVCSSKCHSTFMTFSYIVWYTRDNFELDTENWNEFEYGGHLPNERTE